MSTNQGGGIAAPPLSWRAKLSYGAGDFGFGLTWNMVGAFLLYFYTDVAMLPVGVVGTLFLLSRLLDAAFDPVVGLAVDRTRSRWGRVRPYFLFGAVPFGLFCVACFYVPPLDMGGKLIWACISFVILGLLYSIVNIPYAALMPMMTARQDERVQLGSLRAAGTALSVIVATAATMPLVQALGDGDQASGFLWVAVLMALVTVFLTLNLFVNCREVVLPPAGAPPPGLSAVRDMFRNRAWLVVFLFASLNFVRFGAVLSVTAYFAINILRQPWMISILLPAVSGTLLIGSAIAPPFLKRMGMRNGNRLALAVALVFYALLPFVEGTPWLFLSVYILSSILISISMTAIFAMAAEVVDHHEAQFGTRNEGLLSAGVNLAIKIGMALGGAIVAFGLAQAGYDPANVGEEAKRMVHILYYAPAMLAIALQIVCIGFWPERR